MENKLKGEARLAEVMLDSPTIVVIAGKDYKIRALTNYQRLLISERINRIELAETNVVNLLNAMFVDVKMVTECIAIAILRDRDKIEEELDELTDTLLDCDDNRELLNAITIIINKMDCEFFFGITELIKGISIIKSKAGLREHQKRTKEMEEEYTPIQNLAT